MLDAEAAARGTGIGATHLFYRVLRTMGVFGEHAPATLRELRTAGQRTPDEMVDRYRLAGRPVRDLLVDYLRERQPALDYTSLEALAGYLVGLFWADIERHHPGIDSLHLPTEVADAWKQRLRTVTKTTRTADGGSVQTQRPPDQLPRMSDAGACLLPRPGPLGGRRPRPLGPVGRALPGRGRGDQPAQGQAPPQVPHGRPDPGTAARAADPGPQPSTSAARTPPRCSRPPRTPQPGQAVTAAGQTLTRVRPGPLRRHQGLGRGTRHRETPRPRPGGGVRVLGLRRRRDPAGYRHPRRGADRTVASRPGPVPAAQHR